MEFQSVFPRKSVLSTFSAIRFLKVKQIRLWQSYVCRDQCLPMRIRPQGRLNFAIERFVQSGEGKNDLNGKDSR